jgi:hypothetical protein
MTDGKESRMIWAMVYAECVLKISRADAIREADSAVLEFEKRFKLSL